MAESAPQTFQGVTPAHYARLAQQAQLAGIPMAGNSGSAAKFGVEVSWNYSPEAEVLTIQCLRAPFFLESHQVDAKIRDLIQQSLTA